MNQEFEKDILKGIDPDQIGVDESGYSEQQTDIQIDNKKISGTFQIKQFNRLTKDKKRKKKNDTKIDEGIIFKLKR